MIFLLAKIQIVVNLLFDIKYYKLNSSFEIRFLLFYAQYLTSEIGFCQTLESFKLHRTNLGTKT